MADDQISLPYFLAILIVAGLVIRYFFFSGVSSQPSRSPESLLRSREAALALIQEVVPQADRRSVLWDLQRNGGNIQLTTNRVLRGRLETPPITFQPPPPPSQTAPSTGSSTGRSAERPSQPNLITRYNLSGKLNTAQEEDEGQTGKGWSSNRDERHKSLQQRRDEMILAARRRMEAKLATDKAA